MYRLYTTILLVVFGQFSYAQSSFELVAKGKVEWGELEQVHMDGEYFYTLSKKQLIRIDWSVNTQKATDFQASFLNPYMVVYSNFKVFVSDIMTTTFWFYDRFLAASQQKTLLGEFGEIAYICPSQQSSFWLYDEGEFAIKKYDLFQDRVVGKYYLDQLSLDDFEVKSMQEIGSNLCVLTTSGQLFIWDSQLSYKASIDMKNKSLSLHHNKLSYIQEKTLLVFDWDAEKWKEYALDYTNYDKWSFDGQYLLLVKANEWVVYKLKL